MLLPAGEFLVELDKLFLQTREKGSVYIVMKRTNFKSRKWNKKHPEAQELQQEAKCLVRAYDGKKRKLATQVDVKELQGRFYEQLQILLRANMDALKKRERVRYNAKTKPAA